MRWNGMTSLTWSSALLNLSLAPNSRHTSESTTTRQAPSRLVPLPQSNHSALMWMVVHYEPDYTGFLGRQ